MPLKCPRCGLFSPENSQRCDCGWDFDKRQSAPSNVGPSGVASSRPKTYHEWLSQFNAGPFALDMSRVSVVFAGIPATLIFAVLGLSIFPPGTYPKLLLALPGIVAGGFLAYGLGFLVYKLPLLGYVSCGVVGAVSTCLILLWARANNLWP